VAKGDLENLNKGQSKAGARVQMKGTSGTKQRRAPSCVINAHTHSHTHMRARTHTQHTHARGQHMRARVSQLEASGQRLKTWTVGTLTHHTRVRPHAQHAYHLKKLPPQIRCHPKQALWRASCKPQRKVEQPEPARSIVRYSRYSSSDIHLLHCCSIG